MKAVGHPASALVRGALVVSVAIVALVAGAATLVGSFGANREWVAKVVVPTASSLDSDLFAQLVKGGAIWAERENEKIVTTHPLRRCDSGVAG